MSRPARILYTIPNFVTAGSGQAMVNVIDRLDRRRFEPTVVVRKLGGHLIEHLRDSGVTVMETPFSVSPRPYASLSLRAWSAGRPFRRRFDVWHSFDYADDYTEPLIAYLAGARAWMYTKKNMSWGSRAWKVRSLLARRIAVQNDEMPSRFFSSPLLRTKVRYVPTGIDVEAWETAPPDAAFRASLGVSERTPMIACVGNVQRGKNQKAAVEALSKVPDAHLVLAGRLDDEVYVDELRDKAQSIGVAGRVHLLGAVDNVAALLKSVDLFVFLSRAEGSPVAVLEAMASGLAGVYSSIPGIKERVTDGRDGFLVAPDDVDLIAIRLRQLVEGEDLRRRVGAAARETMLLRGRIESEAARYETLYLELL